MKAIIGKKVGMSQIFDENGKVKLVGGNRASTNNLQGGNKHAKGNHRQENWHDPDFRC